MTLVALLPSAAELEAWGRITSRGYRNHAAGRIPAGILDAYQRGQGSRGRGITVLVATAYTEDAVRAPHGTQLLATPTPLPKRNETISPPAD